MPGAGWSTDLLNAIPTSHAGASHPPYHANDDTPSTLRCAMSNTAAATAADAGATVPASMEPAGNLPATYTQQQSHNSNQQQQQPKMPGCVWTNEAVTLLLSLYLREQQQARPQKLKKKDVWRGICAELWRRGLVCSWQECDKKYRNLKQTFVRNLKQAGKKECRWMFFPLMLEINRHEPFVGDVMLTAGRGGSGGIVAGAAETAVVEHPGQQQHFDVTAAEAEADDKRNDDDLLTGALYTPAPSPTAMNLSQRPQQQRTPSPTLLPSTTDYSVPAPAKRPRRDNHYDQQQQHHHHHHNELTANGFSQPTIIKTESPTLVLPVQQQNVHLHHHHHQSFPHIPANHNNTGIKLSPSPVPDQRRQSSDQPPTFDRSLGPLDIRLLQAAIPFVTHNFIPAHQPMQLQHLQQTLPTPSVPAVKTVPTSPSTMVSTEDDDDDEDEDVDGGVDNDDDHKHKEEQKPLADGVGGLLIDEEETCSMPDLPLNGNDSEQQQQQQQTPPKWFNLFMAEFRRHEQRKLQQIAELCAEVRRTNDIEQQRNHILSEKNEIMRHMNAYMVNK